jgi:hypothetical protein
MSVLRGHFANHRRRSPWSFCWRVTLEGLLLSLAISSILAPFSGAERDFMKWPLLKALFVILIFAPLVETLILQMIPIGLARLFRARFKTQVLVSLIPFALLHFVEGIAVGISAGVIGGFYLAFTYAHWLEKSVWIAIWTTVLSHFMKNSVVAVVLVLARVFGFE